MSSQRLKHHLEARQDTNPRLLAELQKLYRGKGVKRDVFGRRVALPSEVAASVADARRREPGQA